jgi:hypothetical protein
MKMRRLAGMYDRLSVWERIPLLLAADARADDVEYRRLFDSAPPQAHEFPDHLLVEQGLHVLTLIYVTEQLDAAASYFFAVFQMPHDETDDWLFAASAAAYFFATNAAAWRTFCEELSLSPETLVAASYRGGFLKLIEEGMIERAPTAEELRSLRLAAGRSDEPLVTTADLVESWKSTLLAMNRHAPIRRT